MGIRKADHFLALLRRIIVYLKKKLSTKEVEVITPLAFLYELNYEMHADKRALQFAQERLKSLLNTLQVEDIDEY